MATSATSLEMSKPLGWVPIITTLCTNKMLQHLKLVALDYNFEKDLRHIYIQSILPLIYTNQKVQPN